MYLLKPLCGWVLEAIDIVAEKGWIYAGIFREPSDVDFFVGQKEFLKRGRNGIFVSKTFKTDILVQIRPMNTFKADMIIPALFLISIQQGTIPQ